MKYCKHCTKKAPIEWANEYCQECWEVYSSKEWWKRVELINKLQDKICEPYMDKLGYQK